MISWVADSMHRARARASAAEMQALLAAEREAAAKVLQEGRAKLEAALASMTDAVFISDVEGRFVNFNEAFATFHKFRNKAECAKTFGEYPDILDVFMADGTLAPLDMWAVPRALRGETATNTEYTLRRKDTGETWVGSYSFAPIRGENDKIIGSVVVGRDITARKKTENALRRSEERFRKIFEEGPLGMAIVGLDYRLAEVNAMLCQMLGYAQEELTNLTFAQVTHPEDVNKDVQHVQRLLSGDIPFFNIEKRYLKKNGEVLWGNLTGSIMRDETGRPLYLMGMVQDITERQRAEETLRQSEEKYRRLFETMTEGLSFDEIICDDTGKPRDLRYLAVNPAFERQTGLKAADIIGRTTLELFPEAEPLWFERYGKVALTGEPAHFEAWFGPLGRCFEVSAFQTEPGRFAVLFFDTTERKQMEEELRKSEEKSRLLIKHAPSMIYEIDFRGPVFKSVNDVLCQTLGYTREELLAINPLDLLDDESKTIFQERINGRLAGETISDSLEYKGKAKDGREIWGLLNISFTEKDGKPEGALVVAHDITERKRMEEELRKSRNELEIKVQERTAELAGANKELQEEIVRREKAEQQLLQAQKLEAIGTLTGGIAHDFNNILGAVVINSEMALLDLPGESGLRSNLDLILKAGLRGKDLVKQMLLFSRKSEKKQEVLTLTPLIKETFKLLRSSLPTTIQMKLQLETESDSVSADPSQIQQVIMNLCTNAAYAMRGTMGSIDISLQGITFGSTDLPEADMQPGDYLVLSVKDTGSGMDEEMRKRIFEPFFTTKPVGEGTGLGLSVVYGIVKNHKGNITVYSEPGKGSIFKVYLPRVDTRTSVTPEAPKPIPRGNERILLVDDEEFNIKTVQNMLQHLGYKVTALMDSQDALRLFSENPSQFDLVITDQTMPFLTGEDLGKEVMRIRPDIPVILCTGYSDLISSEKAMALGFRGYIMKPFTVREGAELVRRVLDQKGIQW